MKIKFIVIFFIFLYPCFLYATEENISKSFKLTFWGTEIGWFKMKAEIKEKKYKISSTGSSKGLINLFSEYNISSGSIGTISKDDVLRPEEAVLSWSTRSDSNRIKLEYDKEKLIHYQVELPFKNKKYRMDPIGQKNTLDPVSFMLWFLRDRSSNNLCKGRVRVLDGERLTVISFIQRLNFGASISCRGVLERLEGFKPKTMKRKPVEFNILYGSIENERFNVKEFNFETFLGKVVAKEQ